MSNNEVEQGFLKDVYPEVKSIHLKLTYYTDAGTPASIFKDEERTLDPDNLVPNFVECSQSECVNGGFNLGDELREKIRDRIKEFSGKRLCQGWQDTDRINRYRCLYELHYECKIEYHDVNSLV